MILIIGRTAGLGMLGVTYLLAARRLGPEDFGPLAAAAGVGTLALSFADAGLNSVSLRYLAANPDDNSEYRHTLDFKVFIALLLSTVWLASTFLIALAFGSALLFAPLAFMVGARILLETLLVPAAANGRMRTVAGYGLLDRFITLSLTALLLTLNIGGWALTIGLASGPVGSLALLFKRVSTIGHRPRPRMRGLRDALGTSKHFWIVAVASQLMALDTTIVALIAGRRAAGIYGAPARLLGPLGVAASAYAYALFASMSAGVATSPVEAWSSMSQVIRRLAVVTLTVATIGLIAAPEAVQLLLGRTYVGAVGVFRIILLTAAIGAINAPVASGLQALGREGPVAAVVVTAGACGLTLVAGGSIVSVTVAATGVLLAQVLVFVGLLVVWRRANKPRLTER